MRPWDAGFDALTHLHDDAVVGRQYLGLLSGFSTSGRVGAHDADRAVDILFQQLLGREQIEVEVLFQHRQAARRVDAAQQSGLGTHARADVAKRQRGRAARELQLALVLDQGQVFVIDGDGHFLLVGQRAALLFRLCSGMRQDGQ
jgi:hypothetical protein